ncbi:hypothetical protein ACFC9I_10485 [Enterococcus casseliflavus]|uniref:hypothetical protein n=1 Tax=Enterococcus casseliflavus TaxID=37734 RepID=UPI0039A5C2D7
MKITQIQCPSCLGRLEVDWESRKAVCQYCRNELLINSEQKAPQKKEPMIDELPLFQGMVKEGFYPFTFDKRHCEEIVKKMLIWEETVPEDVFFDMEITSLKQVFIPMYYFHIAYDVQVKSSLNVEEYQSKSGRLDATTTLHSSGNSTIFKSTYPTGTEKRSNYSINSNLPLYINKKGSYYTNMVQFATLQEGNIEVLPFDISREKALSDKQLHRALEEKAKEYVIGEDQSSEIQLNVFPKNCDTEKIYFPYYIGEFRYKNTSYSFTVNGTDDSQIFTTGLPKSLQLMEISENLSKARKVFWHSSYSFFLVGFFIDLFIASFFDGPALPVVTFSLISSSILFFIFWVIVGFFCLAQKVSFFLDHGQLKKELYQALTYPQADLDKIKKEFEVRRRKLTTKKVFYGYLENMAYELVVVIFLCTFAWTVNIYMVIYILLSGFVSWNAIRIFTTNSSDRCIKTKG